MNSQFRSLRKQNKVNWFLRNIKPIFWSLTIIAIILMITFFILQVTKLLNLIPKIQVIVDQSNNSGNTTFTVENFNQVKELFLGVKDILVFITGIPVIVIMFLCIRLIANIFLLIRNHFDYKKININKSFYHFRLWMLIFLVLIIFVLILVFGILLYGQIVSPTITFLNNFTDNIGGYLDQLSDIGFNEQGAPNDQQKWNQIMEQLNAYITNIYNNNNFDFSMINDVIIRAVSVIVLTIIWIIYDIVYGSITLCLAKKAFN